VRSVRLEDKTVGDGNPCYFVAEIGGLFKTFEEAKRLIDSAIETGVSAIKFQTLEAETITTKNNLFHLGVTGEVSQYEFFKKFEPSKELQKQIVTYANDKEITIFSAPSHIKDLEIMREMDLSIYKIGSDLACHIPLLKEVAKIGKPIILSTGMCSLDEVRESVKCILNEGNDQVILLHCVSDYPAKEEESNLRAIIELKKEFGIPVGFSDHSIGTTIPLTAAILGANIIEKHMRHPENRSFPDDVHSLTPDQFSDLITSIRKMEVVLGDGKKKPSYSELQNLQRNRVSIISTKKIPKGSIITEQFLDIRRPGTGIQPIYFERIIGMKAIVDIEEETPLEWKMLEES